jgi:anti-anti-sigma factor
VPVREGAGETRPRKLECRHTQVDGASRITITGPLDRDSAPQVEEALQRAESASQAVIVDLYGMAAIDSRGIELLVEAERRVRERGGEFAVIRGPVLLSWLLALARVTAPERPS